MLAHEVSSLTVEEAVREILESQYFRSTAQCSSLFRYIVQNSLSGRDECLKERVIGTEVFARSPNYDTGNDHVVRSRAAEVRKRLAQFYQESGATASVIISIPSGSYRAVFDVRDAKQGRDQSENSIPPSFSVAPPVVDPVMVLVPPPSAGIPDHVLATRWPQFARGTLAGVALMLCCCVAVGVWGTRSAVGRQTGFNRFWAPLVKSPKPVLIYCGGGFVYKLSDSFLDDYKAKHSVKNTRREFFVDLKPGESVGASDLIPDRHFVPFGDLATTARIATTLAQAKKPYDLRYGDDLAFTELRSSPVILIGGLNNSWALKITRSLRYVLENDDRIVDRWDQRRVWTENSDNENQTRDDYAVISRLSDSETGGFVLSIAGIRMYGNRAAADLLSDPSKLDQLLANAPKGWERKNLQIVIHTKTLNDIPVSTDVVATHFW